MEHSFNIEMAAKYGIPAAVIYRNFQFWIGKNKADGRHLHDGRTWSYNTRKGLCEIFPYLSEWQVRAGIKKLVDAGILRTGNYNRRGFDKTLWFAFEDEKTAFEGFPAHWWNSPMGNQAKKPIGEIHQSIGENRQPIPDKTTDSKNKDKEKTSPVLSSADAETDSIQQLTRVGVVRKVARSLVEQDKHPLESIRNAITNALSRRWWLLFKDRFRTEKFNIAGYAIRSLNIAKREGHTVKLSKQSKSAEQLARDRQAGKRPNVDEKMTEKIRQKELKKLGIASE